MTTIYKLSMFDEAAIPMSVLDRAGLGNEHKLDVYDGMLCTAVLKHRMNAWEVLLSAKTLLDFSASLVSALRLACGAEERNCLDRAELELPDALLEEAGIVPGAPLKIEYGDGELTIRVAQDKAPVEALSEELAIFPEEFLELLMDAGVNIHRLQKLLKEEEPIYGI